MKKTMCNDNHKYGNYIERESSFVRICKCCGYESTLPKDIDIRKEYNNQQERKNLTKIIEPDPTVIDSSDSLLRATSILIDSLSYIDISQEEINILITKLNKFNDFYNKEDIERYQIIKNSINFINLFFKHEKLEIIGGRDALTPEQNDEFYKEWLDITGSFTPYLNTLYDNRKNHLQNR